MRKGERFEVDARSRYCDAIDAIVYTSTEPDSPSIEIFIEIFIDFVFPTVFYSVSGHRIVGVEFDELVVRELFDEAGIAVASVEQIGGLQRFSSQDGR